MANSKHILNEQLSDAEKSQLEAFNANPLLKEAVRKVILFPLWGSGTFKPGEKHNLDNFILGYVLNNLDKDDTVIGKDLKIKAMAVKLIETAFMELEAYERPEESTPTSNPAI